MGAALKKTKKPDGIIEKLKKALFSGEGEEEKPAPAASLAPVAPAGAFHCTPEQQQELEALFSRLFTNRSLVTSGRLQMLGFDKIKAKLGDAWPMMQAAVYNVTDEVIREFKTEGDICLRCKDDTYVLIFPQATVAEGWARANLIAEEVGKRLSQLGHEPLKVIQVDTHVCAVQGKVAAGKSVAATLEAVSGATAADFARQEANCGGDAAAMASGKPPKCNYHPLWSVRQKALTSYLCEIENKAGMNALDRDLGALAAAAAELERLRAKGEDFSLFVSVRHGTLYNSDSHQKYMEIFRKIPDAARRNLNLLVVNYIEGLPQERAFWFLPEVKGLCQGAFVEMPMRTKANFVMLKEQGIDDLAVSIETDIDEAVVFGYLQAFTDLARAAGMQRMAGLNLPSLSLVTSSTCMGFSHLGGRAIHGVVPSPDKAHRFRYADLFTR